MKFNKDQYEVLAEFAFSDKNPGYKPNVIEAPNGDDNWDEQKIYAHIAPKYLNLVDFKYKEKIIPIYEQAIEEANYICRVLELSSDFYAGEDSTLRVLKYPPMATTAPHCDFDLFTLCMYRDCVDAFKYLDGQDDPLLKLGRAHSPGIHFGEIMTEINGAKATKHEVIGTENYQHSVVFFVVPNHNSILPSGQTIGKWMEERKNRSRKDVV